MAAALAARHALPLQHKLVQALGWREFFHHVWQHRGDAILESLHDGPRPEAACQRPLPDDIRQARTGVPVIDAAVRTLYATGWLHNHARMWLASYVVHLRGVHWRAGADWLVAHLLDGDLASNHLSWQWIAGTGSHKPYLFNADNVARYAGNQPGWPSPGSVIDTDYATLDRWARGMALLPPAPGAAGGTGVDEPPLWHGLPPGLQAVVWPDPQPGPQPGPQPAGWPAPPALAGRSVWLAHPWALAGPPAGAPPGSLCLGVWPAEFHARWPWSAARWRFVATGMAALTPHTLCADSAQLQQALAQAAALHCTDNGHLPAAWPAAWRRPALRLLADPPRLCHSFSQFWRQATRGVDRLPDLPGWPAGGAVQPGLFDA